MPINKATNKGITRAQLEEVIKNFLDFLEQDADSAGQERESFADCIESYFDDLASDDFFGTEGQSHPFGDKRNS